MSQTGYPARTSAELAAGYIQENWIGLETGTPTAFHNLVAADRLIVEIRIMQQHEQTQDVGIKRILNFRTLRNCHWNSGRI